ncbi:hypothetical protein MBBAR_10c00410 [Methanobrevibacter arboriphilus JCM 13429 = DSM 1125]|uniref:Phage tail protein n=1 Tax=Methanobrevibacter arboriphilus JCM 13429 = DSM 1125 TaxID=1300164 RepID=A0A1V6N1V3_METAZ|nr:hypothetical protein [Methanobrevibacter arboriphilus]OQD58700.1 hypothetical protein MBBAR_10c00410 [Methanobrevibacter arboriphilus JCM 13429 = DSM 1125]
MAVKANVMIKGNRIPHLVKYENTLDESSEKTTTFDGDLLDENETDRKFSISGVRTKEMSKKELMDVTANVPGGYPVTVEDVDTGDITDYTGVRRTSIKDGKEGRKRATIDVEFEAETVNVR